MSFANLFAELVEPSQFELLGEEAAYDPAGAGAARTITVIVVEAKPEAEEAEYVERSKEAVWVAVLTDPDDATYGGIDDPAMGDTLVLRGETTAPYSFRNEIKDRTTNSWALLYDRRRPQAVGPGGTGKLGQNA